MAECRVWAWIGNASVSVEKTQRYEHYARECLRLAQHAKSSQEKDLLVQMAEAWLRLAEASSLEKPDAD
jgi:hypothetical protein